MTYAAEAYMRTENYGNVTVRFIQARWRIKPVKSTATIPWMELMAMELGLTMIKRLIKTFEILPHNSYIWTDSRACHDWVRIETRLLQVFIKNRVLKIRECFDLEQICWVPGDSNPADAATRGMTVRRLKDHKSWLYGPEFLLLSADHWPKQLESSTDVFCDLLPETKEGIRVDSRGTRIIKQAQVLLTLQPATDDYYDPLEPQLLKYNRWKQLTRIVAMCLRWKNKKRGILNPVEIWAAEWALVRLSQAQCYRASLVQLRLNSRVNYNNALAPFAPFLDDAGIV
jgi:hypothetical protein